MAKESHPPKSLKITSLVSEYWDICVIKGVDSIQAAEFRVNHERIEEFNKLSFAIERKVLQPSPSTQIGDPLPAELN